MTAWEEGERPGWLLVATLQIPKGGWAERRDDLQPAEPTGKEQGISPDLLAVLPAPAGLRALVQTQGEQNPELVTESLLCQPPCITTAWSLLQGHVEHGQFHKDAVVLLGREARGYFSGQIKTTCSKKHPESSSEVGKYTPKHILLKRQTPHNVPEWFSPSYCSS